MTIVWILVTRHIITPASGSKQSKYLASRAYPEKWDAYRTSAWTEKLIAFLVIL